MTNTNFYLQMSYMSHSIFNKIDKKVVLRNTHTILYPLDQYLYDETLHLLRSLGLARLQRSPSNCIGCVYYEQLGSVVKYL